MGTTSARCVISFSPSCKCIASAALYGICISFTRYRPFRVSTALMLQLCIFDKSVTLVKYTFEPLMRDATWSAAELWSCNTWILLYKLRWPERLSTQPANLRLPQQWFNNQGLLSRCNPTHNLPAGGACIATPKTCTEYNHLPHFRLKYL